MKNCGQISPQFLFLYVKAILIGRVALSAITDHAHNVTRVLLEERSIKAEARIAHRFIIFIIRFKLDGLDRFSVDIKHKLYTCS